MIVLKPLIDFLSCKDYGNRKQAVTSVYRVIRNFGWHWNVCDDSQFGLGWMIRIYPFELMSMKIFKNDDDRRYDFAIDFKDRDGYFCNSVIGNSFSDCICQMKWHMENVYNVRLCRYQSTVKCYRKLLYLDSKEKI